MLQAMAQSPDVNSSFSVEELQKMVLDAETRAVHAESRVVHAETRVTHPEARVAHAEAAIKAAEAEAARRVVANVPQIRRRCRDQHRLAKFHWTS
jgi:hypothetical protein